jgi:hypothetical protein
MRLDKNHLDQFENISPRTLDTLSLPVTGKEGVCVRVSRSPFNDTATRQDVLDVAVSLRIVDADIINALNRAYEILMKAPGGHQDVCDIIAHLASGEAQ